MHLIQMAGGPNYQNSAHTIMYVHIYAYMHSMSSGISINIQKTSLDSFKLKLQYNAFDRQYNDIRSTLNKTLTRLMYAFLNLISN